MGSICKKQELDIIMGTVRKVIFKNTSTNMAGVSFSSDQIPDFAASDTFKGTFIGMGVFPLIFEKQELILHGKWEKSQRYSWTFKVYEYEEISTVDDKGVLIEYLSSSIFKGIGEKTAKNLVEHFGKDVLNIIKKNPVALSEVRGISPTKAQSIAASYEKTEQLEKLLTLLRPFYLSTKKIDEIYRKYQENSVRLVKENPYILYDDFENIGFKTIDSIARGFDVDSLEEKRIRAGILYVLKEIAPVCGHVFLPFDDLITRAKKALEGGAGAGEKIEKNVIIKTAIDMNNMGEIIIEKDRAAYLPLYHKSELYAAKKLKSLSKRVPKPFNVRIADMIKELESDCKIKYAAKQKDVFYKLTVSGLMVITGGPGTGKTTIIKGVVSIFKRNFPGCRILLAAPTGRAAKKMEEATKMQAKTIHRMLEYTPTGDESGYNRNESNPLNADVVIIDESSMVDLLLLGNLLRAIKPTTTLIFVGDVDQLPSVGPGNILKDMINSKCVNCVSLNEIFRQEEASKIIINAAKINKGDVSLEYDEDFIFIEENEPKAISTLVKDTFVRECRKANINKVQVITPYRKKTENGSDSLNKILQEVINPKNGIEMKHINTVYRIGDKIMQSKNNYDKDIYNGDIGRISRIIEDELYANIDEEEVCYTRDELDEIQLAYASTIHKTQGCEYQVVIIPLTMEHKIMLQRNLIYTGITRAKKKVYLIGQKEALDYAIRNNIINKRYSKLNLKIEQEQV